jgi:hypothetical protein
VDLKLMQHLPGILQRHWGLPLGKPSFGMLAEYVWCSSWFGFVVAAAFGGLRLVLLQLASPSSMTVDRVSLTKEMP